MRRWFISAALLAVAAALGLTWSALGRSPHAAWMDADLTLDRLSFIFEADVDGRPFLEGVDVRSCRVIDFGRITSRAERILEGTGVVGGRPSAWRSFATPGPLEIFPAADAAPAEFWNVRLNQLALRERTRVTAAVENETGFTLTLSEQPSVASLTFESGVDLECQVCRIGERNEPHDVLWLRLESQRERTVVIEGHPDTFTLNLQGIEGEIEKGLALSRPVFYHVEPTRHVSYLVSPATVTLPDVRLRQVEIPARSVLDIVGATGESLAIRSFVVEPSSFTVKLQGRVRGLRVDDREFLFTQLDRLSTPWIVVFAALIGSCVLAALAVAFAEARSRVARRRFGRAGGTAAGTDDHTAMSDVFLSYASRDLKFAERMARALADKGLSVWWDRRIPHGTAFDEEIERALLHARCVIVLWSTASVRSRWVRGEASRAAVRDALVPVLIENAPIPLEFSRLQTAELVESADPAGDPRFDSIIASVRRMLQRSEAADATSPRPDAVPPDSP